MSAAIKVRQKKKQIAKYVATRRANKKNNATKKHQN